MSKNLQIGIIGFGAWGPNFLRVIRENLGTSVTSICDSDENKIKDIRLKYQDITVTTDITEIIEDESIDAVIVATPVTSHFEVVQKLLEAGKHVLCEKALTQTSQQAATLEQLAIEKDKILMVGHVFLFNEAVRFTKEILSRNDLGQLMYGYFKRTGLGPIRQDVNVIWDLASHDISIILYLMEKMPSSVTAVGSCYIQENIEDVAFIIMEFEPNIIINIQVSWLDPVKERKMTLVGQKKMLVFDDVSQDKIKIYNKGVSYQTSSGDFGEFQTAIRDGEVVMPNIRYTEPLKIEFNHFISAINGEEELITDAHNGFQVLQILEAAQKSLENNSQKVFLS